MVVNAPDSPIQAEVIFVIEATSTNGAYISELKTNYLIPTLEYFHGGALEEGGGNGSVYCIVTYRAADCHPGLPVSVYGPFTTPQNVIETVDKLQYVGGHAESRACVTEALTTALACFEELGRTDLPMHILLMCTSPPYSAYAGGLPPPGAPATVDQAARLVNERGVQLSIVAARRMPTLNSLYEHAGGELHQAQQRNYAKDPRHLVLLRGYSLKERPPSPAPPPVPDIQTDMYGQGRGAGVGVGVGVGGGVGVNTATPPRASGALFPRAAVGGRGGWPVPRQPLTYANSALLTQLAQPSFPPPPPQQRMPNMLTPGPSTSPATGPPPPPQRSIVWNGVIEWMEKGKAPGDQTKTTRHLPCQVSASSKDVEPDLKVDTWPSKLLMQLMPKQLISNIGGAYLKESKSVLFHLQPSEALDALTKVMVNGFAGCVHFSPMPTPPQCDIKVLILLYTPDKKAYLGFIPNNQAAFVDRLRKVIQQQKITQIINKQQMPTGAGGSMPTSTMAGAMPTPGMSSAGMGSGASMGPGPSMGPGGTMGPGSSMGPGTSMAGGMPVGNVGQMTGVPTSQSMVQTQMQQHPQGMMIGGMGGQVQQVGGKGPRPVTQLDGLEAARQQNLEKIQHLQQTMDAAHQQAAHQQAAQQQYKSQMDLMSHFHAQSEHYKQMELQQQLQQQLRNAGAGPSVAGGHPSRIMRPLLPSNPGLRHLLQQQPQYRPGGGAARPSAQSQQFDDVSNYDFL